VYKKSATRKQKKDADRKSATFEDVTSRRPLQRSPPTWTVPGYSKKSKGSLKKRGKFPVTYITSTVCRMQLAVPNNATIASSQSPSFGHRFLSLLQDLLHFQ